MGDQITKHQVGNRVGLGCMVNSCRECENCRQGEEQYCLNGHTLGLQQRRPRRHDHPGRLPRGDRRE
ncbi:MULTISPECIES: alcohol dehydrogenase catalytic domain-containing protein [Streptomyces]|uniref:alcohol dehydrogenase catalytic domain-containing protein n=1 Tax=Streptomyces TaxID=1883 RepID=UPI001E2C3274|nr:MULTISPECIES: alcohol dehydrogenase catalytic domain-containing protein [Streptomyces]